MGYTTMEEGLDLVERSYPGRPVAAKVQFLLEEIVSSLDGEGSPPLDPALWCHTPVEKMTYDKSADAVYLALRHIRGGEAAEQVIVEREGKGEIILDFSASGEFLGVEVIGASGLLAKSLLAEAKRL